MVSCTVIRIFTLAAFLGRVASEYRGYNGGRMNFFFFYLIIKHLRDIQTHRCIHLYGRCERHSLWSLWSVTSYIGRVRPRARWSVWHKQASNLLFHEFIAPQILPATGSSLLWKTKQTVKTDDLVRARPSLLRTQYRAKEGRFPHCPASLGGTVGYYDPTKSLSILWSRFVEGKEFRGGRGLRDQIIW